MRLTVRHETIYRYATPAKSVIQQLRLMPRGHDGQFVRRWRVEIDADGRLDRSEDPYGNIMHIFSIDGPVHELSILVDGDVETSDMNGSMDGTLERFPLLFWLRDTPLTRPDPAIVEFAHDMSGGEGGDLLPTLHAINAALLREMRFSIGDTHPGTTAGQAFRARSGVCQDFAHVFVTAARALNIPARYVGGYYLRTDMSEQEAGHAWAEAHVPGVGWIGFDPAHGVCVTDRYVRVTAAPDYLEGAPIRGAHIGGSEESLSVAVHVSQGPVIIEA